jgi:hypothetical protein
VGAISAALSAVVKNFTNKLDHVPQAAEIFGAEAVRQRPVASDPAGSYQLGERLFHRDHPLRAARSDGRVNLVVFAFPDQISDGMSGYHDFDGRVTRSLVRQWDELLGDYRQQG